MAEPKEPGQFLAQELRQALLAVIQQAGRVESCRAGYLVATALGSDYHAFDPGLKYQVNPWNRRAVRALDDLARNGLIVKVPRGQRQPGGSSATRYAVYYSLERFTADTDARSLITSQASAVQHRWAIVRRELAGIGVDMGAQNTVTLGDWEQRILPLVKKREAVPEHPLPGATTTPGALGLAVRWAEHAAAIDEADPLTAALYREHAGDLQRALGRGTGKDTTINGSPE